MPTRGRRSEKLILVWAALRKRRVGQADGRGVVNYPFDVLRPVVSYQYAVQMLSILEEAGYIRKERFGGRRVEYIRLLKDVEELGEDVLGAQEEGSGVQAQRAAPKLRAPKLVALPAITAPAQVPVAVEVKRGVVLVVDYDNIAIARRSAGLEFPAEGLLNFARAKGDLLAAWVFIPMQIVREERLFLRRNGYYIVECPSLKEGGGDTVDRTLEDVVRFSLLVPSVGTVVLVSGDADFQDARRMVENQGRKCVAVHCDRATFEVRSEGGEVIRPGVKSEAPGNGKGNGQNGNPSNGIGQNKFLDVIRGIQSGNIVHDYGDSNHRLVVAIVKVLQARCGELEKPETRKTFAELGSSIWEDIRRRFSDRSRDDTRDALSAMHNSGVLERHQGVSVAYYTFNGQCDFVNRLRELQIL